MLKINIAKDFTRYPTGRFKKNGDTSGEEFRDRFLVPAFESNQKVQIELDGTIGYGSSFLEEAFGGLVRELKTNSYKIFEKFEFVSNDHALILEIKEYIEDATKKL